MIMVIDLDGPVKLVHEGRAVFYEIGHDVEHPFLEVPVRVEIVDGLAKLLNRDLVPFLRRLEDFLFRESSTADPFFPGRGRRNFSGSVRRRRSPASGTRSPGPDATGRGAGPPPGIRGCVLRDFRDELIRLRPEIGNFRSYFFRI